MTTRYVTGTYEQVDGTPDRGSLLFTPSVAIHNGDEMVLPDPIRIRLDATGSFGVDLTCTDDEAWLPRGWAWKVVEKLENGRTFYFELPDGDDVGLAELAPLAADTS